MEKQIKIFLRQSFTESNQEQQNTVQQVFDIINSSNPKHSEVNLLTGKKAENKYTFRKSFEKNFNLEFTPKNFRNIRLNLLSQADLFIIVRTAMSESSAFEIAYNIFKGKNVPMLFLVHEEAPIKTTLIRELEDIADVTYFTFGKNNLKELDSIIKNLINRVKP